MAAQVRIERRGNRLLAVKEAGREPGRLLREAEALARAQVPGVVELVAAPTDDEPVMLTRWIGGRTLADVARPVEPERAAGLVLAVAATVARLHRVGLVHGALRAEHVVLDDRGRPVLCGFADAGSAGAVRRPADDVAALGALLAELLHADGDGGHGEPPARRSRRGQSLRARSRRRALLVVADRAQAPDPGLRPSVGAFADAVRHAAPGASLPPPDHPTGASGPVGGASAVTAPTEAVDPELAASQPVTRPRPARPPRHGDRRWRHADEGRTRARPDEQRPLRSVVPVLAVALAVAATAYLGLTAWRASATPTGSRPPPSGAAPPSPTRPTAAAPSSTTTTRSSGPAGPGATLDAADPGPVGGAPVVVHDGRRYEVGDPGDEALVGRWLCDGRDLVVVLRPTDGSLHLFDRWAPSDGVVEARTVRTVPSATTLVEVRLGPTCSALEVRDGSTRLITLTAEDLR